MKKGFTLLEILVVIGIIVILVGLVSSSYSTTQKKARDSRRKSDIKQIQEAMEQYYSTCNYTYPASITAPIRCTAVAPTTMIMPTVPVDPKTGLSYTFSTVISGSDYTICSNNIEAASPTGYCLSNQQ